MPSLDRDSFAVATSYNSEFEIRNYHRSIANSDFEFRIYRHSLFPEFESPHP
jgi:hypothetical protein